MGVPNIDPGHVQRVVAVLATHIGEANAITKDRLAIEAGLLNGYDKDGAPRPDRRLCEQILELYVDQFPFVICGGTTGMYCASSAEELNHEMRQRMSRIKAIAHGWKLRRRRALQLGWIFEDGRFVMTSAQRNLAPPPFQLQSE